METEEKIAKLQEIIDGSENIVFFGGAGVSTESGIPDFRSVDGLYNQEYEYPPETIISHSFFLRRPAEFYKFYRNRMLYPDAEPNITHKVLAQLEKKGKLKAVITQNIDGLHQLAGSEEVIELHGSVLRNYCMNCGKFHVLADIMAGDDIPKCECGGIIKPDVVLYEEQLDETAIEKTIKYIQEADTLIVAGTSLSVYPAAGFIRAFKGRNLVLINKSSTSYDADADLLIQAGLGQVLGSIIIK